MDRTILVHHKLPSVHFNFCLIVFLLCGNLISPAAGLFAFIMNFMLHFLLCTEMLCWRRMEKISWTDHVRNEEVLLRVNEQRNILHEIRKRKVNWAGHILRRNCLLKQVIEGKMKGEMEVTRRRGRRCKNLLDELKESRGYCHLKEEALDRTMWMNCFGPVVRQNTE